MFEKEVEGGTMVMMFQMTQFMEEDVVAQGLGEADDVEVEIDVAAGRAAAPVGGVVLDGQAVEYEPVTGGKFGDARRKFGLGTAAEVGDFLG